MIKRIVTGGFFVFLFTVLLGSCSSTPKVGTVFNESVPELNSALITTYNTGVITSYNGIAVNWESSGAGDMIQIPAGETVLEWNINSTRGAVIYKGNGMIFKYNFQPHKQYVFTVTRKEGKSGFNVYLYDFGEEIKWSNDDLESRLVAFVPFENAGEKKVIK